MTAKQKPITPYARLLTAFRKFFDEVRYPRTRLMWKYPKDRLAEGWNLEHLSQRVAAAEQLGFEVVMKNTNGDLEVLYRTKRPDDKPWEIR